MSGASAATIRRMMREELEAVLQRLSSQDGFTVRMVPEEIGGAIERFTASYQRTSSIAVVTEEARDGE